MSRSRPKSIVSETVEWSKDSNPYPLMDSHPRREMNPGGLTCIDSFQKLLKGIVCNLMRPLRGPFQSPNPPTDSYTLGRHGSENGCYNYSKFDYCGLIKIAVDNLKHHRRQADKIGQIVFHDALGLLLHLRS